MIESDELNNTLASNPFTNTRIYADLTGTVVSCNPEVIESGQTLSITNGVKNQGQYLAPTVYLSFYASSDATITTGDTLIGERIIANLAPGAEDSATTAFTMPRIPTGAYHIGMVVDQYNYVA